MVPYATAPFERRGSSTSTTATSPADTLTPVTSATTYKFPDFAPQTIDEDEELQNLSRGPSPKPLQNGLPLGLHSSERWPFKKQGGMDGGRTGAQSDAPRATRHGRQKSLSEAIHTVRMRKMSVSESTAEIAESLKAPISYRLVLLCVVWYSASILTNTSSKAILTALPKPVTLTVMQFFLVSFWCIFLSWLAKHNRSIRAHVPVLRNGLRKPSWDIIIATLPLTAFQIGGHILNADAMARIPVSLVHTIKGLSPLMTVLAYRIFFNTKYSFPTYLSLIPLTLGVIMACSASFKGNFLGLTYAFGSAILFVTQNIVSKKIFTDAARAEADGTPVGRRKPDKLNLLCYSSALALIVTFPIWLWSEGSALFADYWHDGSISLRDRPGALDHGRLTVEFVFNGTFHFGQSLVAFVLLGMTSPVTYSVASLIKRVAVILFAIVWFGNPMTRVQGFGFVLTFMGLYLYDRTSDAAKADKRTREKLESQTPLLPLSTADASKKIEQTGYTASPFSGSDSGRAGFVGGSGYSNGAPVGSGPGRPVTPNGIPIAFAPGTKAQETWNEGDTGKPFVR